MSKLNIDQINAFQKQLPAWKLAEDAIEKSFVFKNHSEACGFLLRVAMIAERVNHHPNWSGVYKHVTLCLSTHDLGGVSQKDIDFALEVEKILKST